MDPNGGCLCVIYSVFHPLKGPTIVSQSPDGFIADETFDCISDYIITAPSLAGRLITVTALGHKFVGLPMCIDNPKYPRNQLMFNVTLVFNVETDTIAFEPVIKKLAAYFRTLEVETGFLSKESERDRLEGLLSSIRSDLEKDKQCVLRVDDVHSINLHLFPPKPPPPKVFEHEVPIFTRPLHGVHSWDLCLQQVIPFIDGVLHIRQIALVAEVDVELVKKCIQHLLHFGYVSLVDIFQYRNEYVGTSKLHLLNKDHKLMEECLQYIATDSSLKRPPFVVVYRLLCGMRPGTSLGNLCMQFRPNDFGIDERRLLAFVRHHGLVRRIHRYPILTGGSVNGASGVGLDAAGRTVQMSRWFTGAHCLDWIASHHSEPVGQIESLIRSDICQTNTIIIDKIHNPDCPTVD